MATYNHEQVMLTLCFISYLGILEIENNQASSERIYKAIEKALQKSPPVAGKWKIVWGPGRNDGVLTIFDENLMFVVQSVDDPRNYAVVIRGTNPVSLTNWLLQDFAVMSQTRWPYHPNPPGLRPKISAGTARGLQALQRMKPADTLPGNGMNLYQFLANEVQRNPAEKLTFSVTGHSLGGALSPTLALWMADTQFTSDDPKKGSPWDPTGKATIEVFPFAGPAPGNADFARYYDQRLGPRTRRSWNPFDVVPHGWAEVMLKELPTLYRPSIKPDWIMDIVLWWTTIIARGGNYVQILSDTPALQGGAVSELLHEYTAQMIYQHTLAYSKLLGLEQELESVQALELPPAIRTAIQHASKDLEAADHDALADVNYAGQDIHTAASRIAYEEKKLETQAGLFAGKLTHPVQWAMQRAKRVSASLVLPVVPDFVMLPTLRKREATFNNRAAVRRSNGEPSRRNSGSETNWYSNSWR